MAYFLAPSLVRLRSEVNALWPKRSKASDGWIGDTAHSARKSDHNPDYSAGGIVRAIDVTNAGIDVDAFVSSVIRDARTRYVITRGRIWTREDGWQKYTGTNGHHHHVHVSVRSTKSPRYDLQAHAWGLTKTVGNTISGGKATGPSGPGAAAPKPILQEVDDMGFYVYADSNKAVYFYNQSRGKVRRVPSGEWAAIRAMQSGAAPRISVQEHKVSQHWLDKLVALGTY